MSEASQRLSELFAAALDLPPQERGAFVATACGDDAALRRELEAMLDADQGPAARALEALTPAPMAALQPGQLIVGRYRIVRVLGEGGMGVVYEAEQLQPSRLVALKCMRSGRLHGSALQRFQREAELLGRLRHPGIAQILEAGVTEGPEPQPFFAMEFVRGPDLLTHARTLSPSARLSLFVHVCDAVQHAHARGIVHRDLKPANVLVEVAGGTAQPKVLDFGVARALDAEATLLTRTHEIVGTLAWLAPEQLGGNAPVEPRADVWSLGVMLYQLLADRLPFELGGLSLVAAARIVQDTEPPPLSHLAPALRGDVATIVHTCLSKDPSRRYASAGALAADLRRHFAKEPITARPASALYRLSRFTRRHRAIVAGLTATILALAIGLGLSLHFLAGERAQHALADQRASELRALTRDLVFEVEGKLATVAGATSARQLVVATGLRYAERLLQEAGDDPELLREVGGAFYKLAGVLGDPSENNLGDMPGAEAALQKAIAALQRADALGPDRKGIDALHRCALLDAELCRAQNKRQGRLDALTRARDFARRMHDVGLDEDSKLAFERAAADLGRVQAEMGHSREAIDNFRIFLAGQEPRVLKGERNARRNVVLIHRAIANAHAALGESDRSQTEHALAVQLADAMHKELPDDDGTTALLADSLREQALQFCHLQQEATALPLLERARALLAALPVDDKDVAMRRRRATIEFCLADAMSGTDRVDEARTVLARYQTEADALLALTPQNWSRVRDAMVGQQLATLLAGRAGDAKGVAAAYAEALRLTQQTLAADAESALFHEDLAKAHRRAGEAYERLLAKAAAAEQDGCRAQAVTAYGKEAEALRTIVAHKFDLSWVAPRLAEVEQKLAALSAGK